MAESTVVPHERLVPNGKTLAKGAEKKRWNYLSGGNMFEVYENTIPSKENKEKASP